MLELDLCNNSNERSYRMIYSLNNYQVWLIYLKNWRSYAKPAKSVQNAIFYTHFFEGHFGKCGTTPPMKRVQNLYLGKVSEHRLSDPFVFLYGSFMVDVPNNDREEGLIIFNKSNHA